MCLQLLTAPLIHKEKVGIVLLPDLEFRHRQVRLFVLSPETADPRVSDDFHRWYPGVLWEKRGGDTMLLSTSFTTSQAANLLPCGPAKSGGAD